MTIDVRPPRPQPSTDGSSGASDPLHPHLARHAHKPSEPPADVSGVLREALAIGDVGSWSWHTETDTFAADAVARGLWGFPAEGPLTTAMVRGAIHPDDVLQVQAAAFGASRAGAECNITFRLRRPDAEVRWMRVRARRSETLGPKVIVGVTIDVTERKLVEVALEETERRLERAQTLGGAVPFECDYVTDEVLASNAFKALIGLLPGDRLNNDTLLGRVHPNDRPTLLQEIELCASRPGPHESTCRVILPDDSIRWVLWRGESLPGPDGNVLSFAGVMIDITSRKRIEDELRRSRAEAQARFRELQTLYQNTPVGLALLDRDFRCLRVNQRMAELKGVTTEQVLGQSIFEFLPAIRAREPYLRQVLITGEPVRDLEIETAPAGDPQTRVALKMHYYPLQDERGATVGIGIVSEDVTAQRRAEKARDLLARELSHRIKNLFAVISGIIALSARGDNALVAFARTVRGRIQALAQAHDLVRPSDSERDGVREPATFQGLLRLLLAPYAPDSWRSERIIITGADPKIGPGAATAIALALHEFATNAAKYGSLSVEDGRLIVDCELKPDGVEIVWRERGGPAVTTEPKLSAFGSLLAHRSLVDDLGGGVTTEWSRVGLTLRITLPRGALER
jgi:PAS domain S-box-containing protein